MKKMWMVWIVMVVMSVCVSQASAEVADQGFHDCKVVYVGCFFGNMTLGLTSAAWTGTVWVDLDPTNAKSMLATALTARSLDATVSCWIKELSQGEINQLLLGIGILEDQ